MHKVLILVSVLALFGCGRDEDQTNSPDARAQSQDNKAVTVKKSQNSDDKPVLELNEENPALKWKKDH